MLNITYVSIIFGPVWSYIATSCDFLCLHLGRVIRDLFRLLHALVHSDYPRDATASKCLVIIFGRIASGVSWFIRSTTVPRQLPHQRKHWCWPWLGLRLSAMDYLIIGMSRGMNRVTLSYCYYQTRGYRCCVLYSWTQVTDRLGISLGKSSRHTQNPLSGEWRKPLSRTPPPHALSPHPHITICTSFISSMDCTVLMYYNVT